MINILFLFDKFLIIRKSPLHSHILVRNTPLISKYLLIVIIFAMNSYYSYKKGQIISFYLLMIWLVSIYRNCFLITKIVNNRFRYFPRSTRKSMIITIQPISHVIISRSWKIKYLLIITNF